MKGFEWLRDRWIQEDKMNKLKKLDELSKELNVSMASLAIAWTIHNPNVTSTILGATRKEQLEENFKALDVLPLLTSDLMNRIDEILANKPMMDLA
jgi:aryl-alcohol dehydrogenase-like predicted oxidoreductase